MSRITIVVGLTYVVTGFGCAARREPPATPLSPSRSPAPKAAAPVPDPWPEIEPLLARRDFAAAGKAGVDHLRRHPDHPLAIRLGASLAKQGSLAEALDVVSEAAKEPGAPAGVFLLLGKVHMVRARNGMRMRRAPGYTAYVVGVTEEEEQQFRLREFAAAERAFAAAVEREPSHLDARFLLAEVLYSAGKYPQSLEHLLSVLAQAPDYPRARFALGLAYTEVGRLDEAEQAIKQALVEEPYFSPAHEALANVLVGRGDTAGAQAVRARLRFYEFVPRSARADYFPEADPFIEAVRDPKRRRAEIERMGRQGDAQAAVLLAGFLLQHTHDQDEELAWRALAALNEHRRRLLLALMDDSQSTCTSRRAVEILGEMRDPDLFPRLANLLENDVNFVLPIDVAGAMEELKDPRAIPLLIGRTDPVVGTQVDNKEGRLLKEAATTLSVTVDIGVAQARVRATCALGAFDTPEVRERLGGLAASDAKGEVRAAANLSLLRLTGDVRYLRALDPWVGTDELHALVDRLESVGAKGARDLARRHRRAHAANQAKK